MRRVWRVRERRKEFRPALRISEFPADVEVNLGVGGVVGEAHQWGKINGHLRERAELDAGAKEDFGGEVAAVAGDVGEDELGFAADGEFGIDEGVAERAGELVFVGARAAELDFGD